MKVLSSPSIPAEAQKLCKEGNRATGKSAIIYGGFLTALYPLSTKYLCSLVKGSRFWLHSAAY